MNLLPHIPEREQAMALRRLRRLLAASQCNLHMCTAQLHLVDILLRWLEPPASPPSAIVCNELLELVGKLGGYRRAAPPPGRAPTGTHTPARAGRPSRRAA